MDSHVRLNCCCLPVTCGLPSLRIRKIQALDTDARLEAKDFSAHQSEAAVITPSIVLTIINCLQLWHYYLQLTDYIGHHRDYRAAVLRNRVENMGKGKHFELTALSSRGNCQVPWNAPLSKRIGLTFAELSGRYFIAQSCTMNTDVSSSSSSTCKRISE